jgi:hypothetical protein
MTRSRSGWTAGRRLTPAFLALAACCLALGCGGSASPSGEKEITRLSLGIAGETVTIDEAISSITLTVPAGTSVSNLIATFATTGESVSVGGADLRSGTSLLDLSAPVVLRVTAEDGSTRDYKLTVWIESNPGFFSCSAPVKGAVSITGLTSAWSSSTEAGKADLVIPPRIAGNTVTSIGMGALGSNGLASVKIPSSVTSVGNDAFSYCLTIVSVDFPSSVKSLGSTLFWDCGALSSVTIRASEPSSLSNDPSVGNETFKVYVPSASLDAYMRADGWSTIADHIYPLE